MLDQRKFILEDKREKLVKDMRQLQSDFLQEALVKAPVL
jgi:hypothetical protein